MSTGETGEELRINVEKLAVTDPEDKNSAPVYDYSMRYNFTPKVAGRRADLASHRELVFYGRSLNDAPCPVHLALVARDGTIYGATVTIDPKPGGRYAIPISAMKPVRLVSLPVPELEASLPFYEKTMGFRVVLRTDMRVKSAVISRDNIQIGLAENGGDPTQDGCFLRSIRWQPPWLSYRQMVSIKEWLPPFPRKHTAKPPGKSFTVSHRMASVIARAND